MRALRLTTTQHRTQPKGAQTSCAPTLKQQDRAAKPGPTAASRPSIPHFANTLACATGPRLVAEMRLLWPVSVSRMHNTLEERSRAV